MSVFNLIFPAFFLLISLPGVCYSQYYKWVDEQGITHLSDQAPTKNAQPLPLKELPVTRFIEKPIKRKTVVSKPPAITVPSNTYESSSDSYELRRQRRQELYNEQRLAKKCERYRARIKSAESRLRAGGYSSQYGNILRAERREFFGKLARECLRN